VAVRGIALFGGGLVAFIARLPHIDVTLWTTLIGALIAVATATEALFAYGQRYMDACTAWFDLYREVLFYRSSANGYDALEPSVAPRLLIERYSDIVERETMSTVVSLSSAHNREPGATS
jgi:hypothetical protein